MMRSSSKDMKRLNHLIGETEAVYHEMAVRFGLSDSAVRILYTICDYDDGTYCPLQIICRRTGISKQTINSAMRKLEDADIVYLTASGSKNKTVYLTEKGKSLASSTALRMIEIENHILDFWSKEDVEKYLELTERFLIALREQSKGLIETDGKNEKDREGGGSDDSVICYK